MLTVLFKGCIHINRECFSLCLVGKRFLFMANGNGPFLHIFNSKFAIVIIFFFSNFILSNLPLFWALVTLIFPLALVTSFFLFLNLEMGSLSSFWLLNSSNPALQTHYVCKKSCCYHDKAKTRQRALTGCY